VFSVHDVRVYGLPTCSVDQSIGQSVTSSRKQIEGQVMRFTRSGFIDAAVQLLMAALVVMLLG